MAFEYTNHQGRSHMQPVWQACRRGYRHKIGIDLIEAEKRFGKEVSQDDIEHICEGNAQDTGNGNRRHPARNLFDDQHGAGIRRGIYHLIDCAYLVHRALQIAALPLSFADHGGGRAMKCLACESIRLCTASCQSGRFAPDTTWV